METMTRSKFLYTLALLTTAVAIAYMWGRYSSQKVISAIPAVDASSYKTTIDASPPLFKLDGYIRDCITSGIVGQMPPQLNTYKLRQAELSRVENAVSRKRVFQSVFDKRIWGAQKDGDFGGPVASGR